MSHLLKHTPNATDGWLSSPLPAAKTISQQLEVLLWGNVVLASSRPADSLPCASAEPGP